MEKIRFYKGDLVSGTKYHCSIGKLFDMFQGLLIYSDGSGTRNRIVGYQESAEKWVFE